MQLITCHHGRLERLFSAQLRTRQPEVFRTGLAEVDNLLPGGGFAGAAIHEILSHPAHGTPFFFAMLIARAAAGSPQNSHPADASPPTITDSHQAIIWCDPAGCLYPPALVAAGINLEQLYLLHPQNEEDLVWSTAECLRCRGVAAVVAAPPRLSRIQARRLQLAAETGGGAGILLRPAVTPREKDGGQNLSGKIATAKGAHYAAATRWLVMPAAGQRTVQRWKIQLIHCHGGNTEKTIILEHCRETHCVRATNSLRAIAELAHRPAASDSASPHSSAVAQIAGA